jgi:hypothetical protein
MQILAEAEDLPKTANIKTRLINLCGITLLRTFMVAVVQGRHR